MESVLINDLVNPTPGEREFVQIINEIAEDNTELSLILIMSPKEVDVILTSPYIAIITVLFYLR